MKYFVGFFCACLWVPVFAQSSASFRGDAQHSGIYQQIGAPVLHGIKWKFKTGAAVISTPAVLDGTAYFGSNDQYLYAVNLADGTLRWKFKTNGRPRSQCPIRSSVRRRLL